MIGEYSLLPTSRPPAEYGHRCEWSSSARTVDVLSYALGVAERVELDVDETTAAYLHRFAHQRGVSVGIAAARQLRALAWADAGRALAEWDGAGAYAEAQTEERERAAAGE